MFNLTPIPIAALLGSIYVLVPLAVRWTFRAPSHCRPSEISLGALPNEVMAMFAKRIPELQKLGFEFIGCFDFGSLAAETHSYVAYFCNRCTNDFANVTVLLSPGGATGYLEFSARFANGQTLETNSNRVLPLTPSSADTRVFRFTELQDAEALLHAHRQILEKYAPGLRAQSEPRGAEIQRFVRTIENYGPRHRQLGYMRLSADGEFYKLTWKGAFLMTWCGLWPVSFVRQWIHRHAMHAELHSLETADIATLQKV